MGMGRRSGNAFTLVELVIVIAIIGILAAIAIPRFIDIRSQAYSATRDGIVGSVRSGIMLVASRNQATGDDPANTFPADLEGTWGTLVGGTSWSSGTEVCDTGNSPCFELVIRGGVEDDAWAQTAAGNYTWTNPADSGDTLDCVYSDTTGLLTCS